jgi:IS30 family transposase
MIKVPNFVLFVPPSKLHVYDDRLLGLLRSYNHTPRKCLNYKTPAEVFTRDLLHFKCKSTFPRARE